MVSTRFSPTHMPVVVVVVVVVFVEGVRGVRISESVRVYVCERESRTHVYVCMYMYI